MPDNVVSKHSKSPTKHAELKTGIHYSFSLNLPAALGCYQTEDDLIATLKPVDFVVDFFNLSVQSK